MKYVTGTRTVNPQTTVVTCQGEMDTLAVEEMRQAVDPLLSDAVSHLIFDLAAVEYLSSSVLSFLLAAQSKAKEKSGKVSLVAASELVKQSFEMAALDGLFAFYGTIAEAGVVEVTPPQAKGKEKTARQKKAAEKGNGPSPVVAEEVPVQRAEEKTSSREKVTPVNERRTREELPVEKIQPRAEPKSWRDYGAWIGIGVLVVVSVAVSLYLYVVQP